MKRLFFFLGAFAIGLLLFFGAGGMEGIKNIDLLAGIDFRDDPCPPEGCFVPPPCDEVDPTLCNDTNQTFRQRLLIIINYFLGFAGLAAVIAVIYGGFLWIFSGGEEENITKGRKIVIWAGAGIILILLSFAIVRFFVNAGRGDLNLDQENLTPVEGSGLNPDGTPINGSGGSGTGGSSIDQSGGSSITTVRTNNAGENEIFVKITGSNTSGVAPLTVELSGLGSRYPEDDQTIPDSSYHWSYVNASGNTINLGTGNTVVEELSESGRFVFKLRIDPRSDGVETSAGEATFAVEIFPANPDVEFLINGERAKFFQQFALSNALTGITFKPNIQNTGQKQIEEFLWNFGDGSPGMKTESDEVVQHIYPDAGEYKVSLTVTDNLGKSYKKQVTLGIQDTVARFDVSPSERFVEKKITFDGSDSESSFGDIISHEWILIDAEGEKEEIKEERFARTFSKSGNVQISLTVSDTAGKTATAAETIVIASNPPEANFTFASKEASQPSVIKFDASRSQDKDGDALAYSWDFQNDGSFEIQNDTSTQAEFEYSETGAFDVRLKVTDTNGESDETVRQVEIDSVLNVDFTASTFVAHPDEEIIFDATAENAITFFWDFGDGANEQGTEESVSHSFLEKGRYKVKLTAFDVDDEENMTSRTVYIGERDMPVAAYDVRQGNILYIIQDDICGSGKHGIEISRADKITLDASASIDATEAKETLQSVAGRSGLEYEWVFHDGTFSRKKMVTKRFDEVPSEEACYPVELTITDDRTGRKDTAETLWIKIINKEPEMDVLQVSLPKNTSAPVIVPLKVQNARDPDGNIVEYKWWAYRENETEKVGLHTTTIPSTSLILPVHGFPDETHKYFFVVEIMDNFGATLNSEEVFGVSNFVEAKNGENRSPLVDFEMEKATVDEGDTITFFATAEDPFGDTIPDSAYMWDFDGDNVFDAIGTGPQAIFRYDEPGEYNPRLKVVYRGLASSKSKSVFVARKHELPKAAFLYQLQGHNVQFDASTSEVDDSVPNNTVSYEWDLDLQIDSDGDGDSKNDTDETSESFSHFYEELGKRSIKLTITDRLGVQDTVTRDVPVLESGKLLSGSGSRFGFGGGNSGIGSATGVSSSGNAGLFAGIVESVRMKSSHPMTTLDLVCARGVIPAGESTRLLAFVKNANNTLFQGTVEFKIISGNAQLSKKMSESLLGEAFTEITGLGKGRVVIEATAKDTVSGDISEIISLFIE